MERPIPTVWGVWGGGREWMELAASRAGDRVLLDSPAWFAWLAADSTTRFADAIFDVQAGYIVGFLTVRQERRQRGGGYWVAYRRVAGPVRKVYLGRNRAVTAQQLHALARLLDGKEVTNNEPAGQ